MLTFLLFWPRAVLDPGTWTAECLKCDLISTEVCCAQLHMQNQKQTNENIPWITWLYTKITLFWIPLVNMSYWSQFHFKNYKILKEKERVCSCAGSLQICLQWLDYIQGIKNSIQVSHVDGRSPLHPSLMASWVHPLDAGLENRVARLEPGTLTGKRLSQVAASPAGPQLSILKTFFFKFRICQICWNIHCFSILFCVANMNIP